MNLPILFVALTHLCSYKLVTAVTVEFYMDSDSTCGQTKTIYDRTIYVGARATISSANPPPTCTFTILSGYTDSYYYIKIERTSVINDCLFSLNIYLGTSAGGQPLKSFSCGSDSSSVDVTVAKSNSITLYLSQPRDLYQPQNTFSLKITTYRDPNAPDSAERVSSLPTGAIIGIVVGAFIFIAFAILMCFCYKQGKLQFLRGEDSKAYTYRASADMGRYESEKAESTGYPESTIAASEMSRTSPNSVKRNFNLDDPSVWTSLTNTPSMARKVKPVDPPKAPPLPMTGARMNYNDRDTREITRESVAPAMSSAGRRQTDFTNGDNTEGGSIGRIRGRRYARNSTSGEGRDASNERKRNSFENKGYENYDNDDNEPFANRRRRTASSSAKQENEESTKKPTAEKDKEENKTNENKAGYGGLGGDSMLKELKREISRRQSMREEKDNKANEVKDTEEGEKKSKPEKDEAADKKKTSPKRSRKSKKKSNVPEELGTLDLSEFKGVDQQSEIGDSDKITNPMLRTNPAIRASVSSLRSRGDESSGTKKKKRKKKYVGVHRDRTKSTQNEEDDDAHDDNELDTTPVRDTDPLPPGGYGNYGNDNAPLPPEALAPVFATDAATMQHFYPPDQYNYQQQQQQPVPVLVGYDGYGNPLYNYVNQTGDMPVNVPYTQAGQAAWYVQNTPSKDGPVTQAAFIMTHTASTPDQSLHGGQPGTYDPNHVPGYYIDQAGNYVPVQNQQGYPGQDPYNKHHGPHGKRSRSKSASRHPGTVVVPGGYNDSIVPAGTILDDPQVPPPGGTLIRSTVDPDDGTQTNQMVWTDGNRDPTDPPLGTDNPQITRKTIVRVTTKSTEQGTLPEAPNPALQEMSFNAAHQLRAQNGEPAFLSPSKRGGQSYAPQPVYATETPERDNAAFYSKIAPAATHTIPGGLSTVHDNPMRSQAFRNTVKLSNENHDDF